MPSRVRTPPLRPNDRVIIIGAGLSALSLAQGLQKYGIPVDVFERDNSATYRPQGYRIKTFEQTEQDMRYLLPERVFEAFENTCAETVLGETTCNAINGQVIASRKGWKPRPWTVDREVLRNTLLLDLDDHVHFNREYTKYTMSEDKDTITAHFADGSSETGTLLIGADGIHSRVRRQLLPSHRYLDTTGVCIYGKTPFSTELERRFPSHALKWITTFRDDAPLLTQVMTQTNDPVTLFVDAMRFVNRDAAPPEVPIPEDYVYWAMLFRRHLLHGPEAENPAALRGDEARAISLDLTSEWDPAVRSVLELQNTKQTAALPIFCTHPEFPAWEPSARITLLGDAMHAMPVSGAVGAVTALHDSAELVKTLIEKGASKESIGSYEKDLRTRSSMAIMRSLKAGGKLFNQPPLEQCKEVKM